MEAIERTLSTLECSKDKDGYTFMEHLTELMDRVMANPAQYPLDKVEELSYLIKLTRLKVKQPRSDKEVRAMTAKSSETMQWISQYLTQIRSVLLLNNIA